MHAVLHQYGNQLSNGGSGCFDKKGRSAKSKMSWTNFYQNTADTWHIWAVAAILFYFLPSFVAYGNKRFNKQAILVLNVAGGWTVVGWIVALTWAFVRDPQQQEGEQRLQH